MCDPDMFQVEQTPEQLVSIDLKLETRHGRFFTIFLHGFVQILLVIVHDHIQIFLVILVSEERILHGQHIRVREDLQDIQLPIFVVFVLKHLLYCHYFQTFSVSCFVDCPEGATAHLLLYFVSGLAFYLV